MIPILCSKEILSWCGYTFRWAERTGTKSLHGHLSELTKQSWGHVCRTLTIVWSSKLLKEGKQNGNGCHWDWFLNDNCTCTHGFIGLTLHSRSARIPPCPKLDQRKRWSVQSSPLSQWGIAQSERLAWVSGIVSIELKNYRVIYDLSIQITSPDNAPKAQGSTCQKHMTWWKALRLLLWPAPWTAGEDTWDVDKQMNG